MDQLTAVVIAKNEALRIRDCLVSFKGFADEIIVVDDCSNDATADIARSLGAKVIVNPSGGDFSLQRNLGMDSAICPWVIQCDADESVPPPAAVKIKEVLNNPGEYAAFEIRRKNFLFGKPLLYGGSVNYGLKILKKGICRYKGKIHEIPVVNGPIGRIDVDIEHYPFPTLAHMIGKMNMYTDIEAAEYVAGAGKIEEKDIRWRLTGKSLKLFWKLYVRKRGYKDGMAGLIWCIMNVIGPQVKWIKIYEQALLSKKLAGKGGADG